MRFHKVLPLRIEWSFQLLGIYRGKRIDRTRCHACLRQEDRESVDPRDESVPKFSVGEQERAMLLTLSSVKADDPCLYNHEEDAVDFEDGMFPLRLIKEVGATPMTRQREMINDAAGGGKLVNTREGQCDVFFRRNVEETRASRESGGGMCGQNVDKVFFDSLLQESIADAGVERGCGDSGYGTTPQDKSCFNQQGASGGGRFVTTFTRECAVCESLTWNGDASSTKLSDADKDPAPSRRSSMSAASFVGMAILMAIASIVAVHWLSHLFGITKQVMQLTSFMCYWLMLSAPTAFCVHAHLMSYAKGGQYPTDIHTIDGRHWGWYPVLHQDYVLRRFRYLATTAADTRRIPTGWLAIAVAWPIVDFVLEMVFGLLAQRDAWGYTEIATSLFLSVVFIIFCMFLSLLRRAFESELEVDFMFVLRHTDSLDWCRIRLSETYRDFRLFNNLVYDWMLICNNLGILGLTVHLTWNYLALSYRLTDEDLTMAITLDLFIASEKFLVLFLPLVALRGCMDLDYLWTQFRLGLSRHRRAENEMFWDGLIRHVDTLRYGDHRGNVNLKMLLTFSSLYLGLRIGSQNWDYHGFLQTTTVSPVTIANSM